MSDLTVLVSPTALYPIGSFNSAHRSSESNLVSYRRTPVMVTLQTAESSPVLLSPTTKDSSLLSPPANTWTSKSKSRPRSRNRSLSVPPPPLPAPALRDISATPTSAPAPRTLFRERLTSQTAATPNFKRGEPVRPPPPLCRSPHSVGSSPLIADELILLVSYIQFARRPFGARRSAQGSPVHHTRQPSTSSAARRSSPPD